MSKARKSKNGLEEDESKDEEEIFMTTNNDKVEPESLWEKIVNKNKDEG